MVVVACEASYHRRRRGQVAGVDPLLRLRGVVHGVRAGQARVAVDVLDRPVGAVDPAQVRAEPPTRVLAGDTRLGDGVVLAAEGAARAGVGHHDTVVGAAVFGVLVAAQNDAVSSCDKAVPQDRVAGGQRPRVRDNKNDRRHAVPRSLVALRQPAVVLMPSVQFRTQTAVLTLVPRPGDEIAVRDSRVLLPDAAQETPTSSQAKFASLVANSAEKVIWRPLMAGEPDTSLRKVFEPSRLESLTEGAVDELPTHSRALFSSRWVELSPATSCHSRVTPAVRKRFGGHSTTS